MRDVLSLVIVAVAYSVGAQVYQVGPAASNPRGVPSGQSQAELGWGSNIENARLAHAAQQALQHGDYFRAVEYAQRAAEAAPNDAQQWFLLGYAARLAGKFQQSVDAYNHGLRVNPGSLDGTSGLAQVFSTMGRSDEAERLLKQVIAADPRRRDDALLLGNLYMRSADYANAIDWLERAERDQPNARSELLLALCYQRTNRMEQANRYLLMAQKRAPDNLDVQRSLAGYYRAVGNDQLAIATLRSIRNPKPDVTAELAYTYQLAGRLDEAAKVYALAANAEPKNLDFQLSAAQAAVATGSVEQANSFLKRGSEIDANHYRLHAILAEVAQMEERDQDAVSEYRAALANSPQNPPEGALFGIQLHMNLLSLYRNLGNEADAHRELEIAQTQINQQTGTDADRGSFLRLSALIKMNAGDLNGALPDIKKSLATDRRNRSNLQLNGDILMKLGRPDDAIAAYREVLDIDPDNRLALIALGYATRAAGRNQDAEKYFRQLARVDSSSYVPFLALGDMYTALREFTAAEEAYSRGYAIAPGKALIVAGGMNAAIEAHNLSLAATWLGRVSGEMEANPQVLREKERYLSFDGKYVESAAVGQRAIKLLPRDRDIVVYLGYDYLRLERYDELLSLMSKYLTVLPAEPDIPLLAGYVHKHQGMAEEAREDFTEALKRDPTVVTAYVNRGYMLNDLHRPQAAADDFESALKQEPDNGEAHLGLAYSNLELHRSQAALHHAELAERSLGDSKDIHVIRATAYGREGMLSKSADEYRAALKFAPNDAMLYRGLGDTLFAERQYRDAIKELERADQFTREDSKIDALLARCYAELNERGQAMKYVEQAESHVDSASADERSGVFLAAGEALSVLGDQKAAIERFERALTAKNSDRVGVRLAIAQLMQQQDHTEDAERQIALALMEAEAGETEPASGPQLVEAADVFRSMHDYQLSQNYLERAKNAGAPDTDVRLGMADNYLAMGDTTRAEAQLAAVRASAGSAPGYQYLLAEANMYRQKHENAQALTAFAQASNAQGEDQAAQQGMLEAGADEGLRITPTVSMLSDFSMQPVFEDTTVYVLDSKLDATSPVPSANPALLPPPRSSLQTQWTGAFHLHLGRWPTPSGFFQVRNARGLISVPSTNSIVNRNTTDYTVNFGLNPTVHLGDNILTFDSGIQGTIRRDSLSPVDMNQNLFRVFTYLSTSSFFNAVSLSGYVIHETGPFTESNLNSRSLAASLNFRVGSPWGKTALVTGWGMNDQQFSPVNDEDYYTSSYVGLERRFAERLNVRLVAEDLRAWRAAKGNSGIAQDLRPAGTIDFSPRRNWDVRISSAYSSTRGFHVYDAVQNGFFVSYAMPFHRKFHDDSGEVMLQYPIRFSAGVQEEKFINFSGGQSQQLRPYIQISIF